MDTMIFTFEVSNSCRHNWLVVRLTRVPQGTKDEFWQGIDRADQPNFPPQRFLTKAILTARMVSQILTK